jgi:hypothetical protein
MDSSKLYTNALLHERCGYRESAVVGVVTDH